ncbi:carotenoid oxygenase family protein [Leptolyngbya sp. 7M]|uniref:carotenoid oxygenase family protein n=1 Tax=Leptolyngbya sp. 7M TaxID=2812896 RepID=UPI001B8D805F|nr:carotenoid oxygenase family protein [Leptolyngbya sp. 7M]QYO68011.1 carotenoid oxygenase family protein [Leptolyngbya sp. 7M]
MTEILCRLIRITGVGCSQSGYFIDQLVKVDVQNRNAQIWHQSDCYPGEPVFVAVPDAATEDEGVILSVGLDSQTQNSFLLILNAHSWDEMARVQLPYHLPFDFHGQYFDPIASSWSYLHR